MNALARTVELRAYRGIGSRFESPLLDLGCGDSGVALTFTALGLMAQPICGVDLGAVDLARARRSGAHRDVVRADARQLPFPDGCFATVLANGVLYCLTGGVGAPLAEIRRVLRFGGLFVASMPTRAFTEVLLLCSAPSRLRSRDGMPAASSGA